VLQDCFNTGTRITVPEGVTRVDADAFSECEHLTEIVLPDSVTTIGTGAFSGCSRLTDLTIPDGVTVIDGDAFRKCSRLTVRWSGKTCKNPSGMQDVYGILCPQLPFAMFADTPALRRAATRGFLQNPAQYTDADSRSGYIACAVAAPEVFLPDIFAADQAEALSIYAEHGTITADNFDAEYLTPAITAHAAECTAFLVDWKYRNLPETDMWTL
jgi:hypothetical protein